MRKIKYPLIVSDFDGTLVREDGTISQRNKEAIKAYVNAGGKFAISTGRMPAGVISHAQELGLTGNVCCCQGAIIMDIQTKELILEGRLSLESTIAGCKKMEELGLHVHVYDLWEYYSNMDDAALKMYERAVRSKAKLVLDRPISQFVEENGLRSYKLLAMVEPEKADGILQELEKDCPEGCSVTKSADYLAELVNTNHSKGTAVRFLAEYYGVPIEKTIAVGDQQNDLPMIETAGLGIAVCNATEGLKQAADYVCACTNEEDAIAEIIEKFGFVEE